MSVLQSGHGFSFLKAADLQNSVYQVKRGRIRTRYRSNVYRYTDF